MKTYLPNYSLFAAITVPLMIDSYSDFGVVELGALTEAECNDFSQGEA
jgi:hypothetical protein